MKMLTQQELLQIVEKNRIYTTQGKVADYIPELSNQNPATLGITMADVEGKMITVGDCGTPFTLQSISKVISLMVALMDHGHDKVFSKVGMEPSGDPYNSIVKLETLDHKRPLNPMINAGAIAVASLIKGGSVEERLSRVCDILKQMVGREHVQLDQQVYLSEKNTGDRNRSLAYFMKSTGIIETDVEEALDLYFRLCSISVTCSDLARIGVFFANGGCLPDQTCQLVDFRVIQTVMMIMLTSGMYNASGEFGVRVGFPAKSGVSGGILAVVPNRFGIGVIGPAIDEKGNSIAGMKILEEISNVYGLHLFTNERKARTNEGIEETYKIK